LTKDQSGMISIAPIPKKNTARFGKRDREHCISRNAPTRMRHGSPCWRRLMQKHMVIILQLRVASWGEMLQFQCLGCGMFIDILTARLSRI
jgi:hypothetical protein